MTLLSNEYQTSHQENLLLAALESFLHTKKAKNILLLNVQRRSQHFTHVLIVTALSSLHLKSLAEECIRFVRSREENILNFNAQEFNTGWAIIDCGDFMLHLFLESLRTKYNLEELYRPENYQVDDYEF